jgi:hypothetical protein
MFLRRATFKSLAIFFFILVLATAATLHYTVPVRAQDETDRAIIADDFLKHRRKAKRSPKRPPTTYKVAKAATKRSDQRKVQVGVTIWKLEPAAVGHANAELSASGSNWNREDWIPRRVEADVEFREGDKLRISIESPRDGYLYVVNRDWLADGSYGETNLIFPKLGEDNRLEAGKLIDIPAPLDPPFKASPKPNQMSELLTIIVTSLPLKLRLGRREIPISKTQLREWEERWGGEAERLEMNGGAGQARTEKEKLAVSSTRSRQLTRDDPMPQTIYSLAPKNIDGLLFNLVLLYGR